MTTTICPRADAYLHVEKLVYKTCHRFKQIHGGPPFDELLSEAHAIYAGAFESFRSDRGAKFSTWVAFSLWHGLLEYNRKLQREWSRQQRRIESTVQPAERFCLESFMRELSADAQRVIGMALKTNHNRVSSRKHAIMTTLQDLGWSDVRIGDVFGEIREALP